MYSIASTVFMKTWSLSESEEKQIEKKIEGKLEDRYLK